MTLSNRDKNKITSYFADKKEVAAVYLYGSQARNDAREDSDIDLGILLAGKIKQRGLDSPQFSAPFDLGRLLNKEVEVQDLEACGVDFAHRVLTEGKLLISNNEKVRITFVEKVLRDYFDLKPLLDEYYKSLSEIAKRGELHVRYT